AVGIDEPQVVNRSLRILQTGDWNPHVFDYPTLVIYFHAAVAILRFLWGALDGQWASLDAYRIEAVYAAGRFMAACIGVAPRCSAPRSSPCSRSTCASRTSS